MNLLVPEFLKLNSQKEEKSDDNFEEGTLVELHFRDQNNKYEIIYGVIKWIGFSTNDRSKMAGIELLILFLTVPLIFITSLAKN